MKVKKPITIDKIAKEVTHGRVQLLHALPYLGCMVYIMRVDDTLFTYHAIIDNKMYFSYVEAEYEPGQTTFTDKQVQAYVGITMATAHSTIETVTGKVNKKDQEMGEVVEKAADAAGWNDDKKPN